MKTIQFRGFEFKFKYTYQPAERQTHEDPGCDEYFEIYDITLNGIDASELLFECLEEFEEEAIEQIKYK
jgi:hypothetical protein